jgi:hypothetical protein
MQNQSSSGWLLCLLVMGLSACGGGSLGSKSGTSTSSSVNLNNSSISSAAVLSSSSVTTNSSNSLTMSSANATSVSTSTSTSKSSLAGSSQTSVSKSSSLSSSSKRSSSSRSSSSLAGSTPPYDTGKRSWDQNYYGPTPVIYQKPATLASTSDFSPLKPVPNIQVVPNDHSVVLNFDALDDAWDYRVYPMPAQGSVTNNPDGSVTVKDAIYRCAGTKGFMVNNVGIDNEPWSQNPPVRYWTLVDDVKVSDFKRYLGDALLGHVYSKNYGDLHPELNLTPVVAVGESQPFADEGHYHESRLRIFIALPKGDAAAAQTYSNYLANSYRDDGVVFYLPAAGDGRPTTTLYGTRRQDAWVNVTPDFIGIVNGALSGNYGFSHYYYTKNTSTMTQGSCSNEHCYRTQVQGWTAVPAFNILQNADLNTMPLYRVFSGSHDELAVGKAAFDIVRFQGSQVAKNGGKERPATELLWSDVRGPMTLVVEALDSACPHPGALIAARDNGTIDAGSYTLAPWKTVDSARDPVTGEVFLNGQGQGTNKPKVIARSFVNVQPKPRAQMDWMSNFNADTAEIFNDGNDVCADNGGNPPGDNCFTTSRATSDTYDASFTMVATDRYSMGQVLGELRVTFTDTAVDTNGKFRLTVKQPAVLTADSYMHATMEVDHGTSSRRYPQLLITDQPPPVNHAMINGNSLVLQTFPLSDGTPNILLQVCDHITWDVNAQCPFFQFHSRGVKSNTTTIKGVRPAASLSNTTSVEHRAKFDIYASSERAYIYYEDKPYGCADLSSLASLPAPLSVRGPGAGDVWVTFGDVLYHSDIDMNDACHVTPDTATPDPAICNFKDTHLRRVTQRHFDNLGFSSNVQLPTVWDHDRFSCTNILYPDPLGVNISPGNPRLPNAPVGGSE